MLAARKAEDKKAEDIVLLDMKKASGGIADYVLIVSANSGVHMKTLRDAIEESLYKKNLKPIHQDGRRSDQWMALDYGGLLVHILSFAARRLYNLERLWENAKEVSWDSNSSRKRKKR